MRRVIFFGIASILLSGGTGCGVFHSKMYAPFGPGTLCDTEHGACGCGPVCGPVCAPCAPSCGPTCGTECGVAYDECCEPECCEPCAPCCGPTCHLGCGPLAMIAHLLKGACCCGHGCGEIYWGDFHGDPPDCRDPCDCYGNFTGGCVGGYYDGGYVNGYDGGYVDGYVQQGHRESPASHAPQLISQTDRVLPAPRVARTRRATRR